MLKLSRMLPALALVPLILMLAGCETLTPELNSKGALAAFQPISNSAEAPCDMQKEVASHNSAYDTLKNSKLTIYKAPCVTDPKPAPPAPKPKPAAKPKPAVS